MDTIFEYLPFIIGAIYYIFIRKRNKEKVLTESTPPVIRKKEDRKVTLEDILKEISGQNKPLESRPVQNIQKRKVPIVEPEIKRPETPKRSVNIPNVIVKNVEEIESEVNFDLREAIISQTILNRPVY